MARAARSYRGILLAGRRSARPPGRVRHYIHNSGAMAILVKDYSSDIDSAQLVTALRFLGGRGV